MARGFILVIDSFGIGAAADADKFGDVGSDTLGHIAEACDKGLADVAGLRSGPLALPNLVRLGLGRAAASSRGQIPPGLQDQGEINAAYGYAGELSYGKDTPSGHWEMAGLPVLFDWGFFPNTEPCFPADLIDDLVTRCGLPGILGNRYASGTEILVELGEEHIRTGKPICYTSADSVFQIAAHEQHFGLDRLYDVCSVAQEIFKPMEIGRVIARPFIGRDAQNFQRTANRRDLTKRPHGPTLLDRVFEAGGEVVSVGKISDIFAGRAISRKVKAGTTDGLFDLALAETKSAGDGALVFINFVDFDSLYGHRRDIAGYAAALEALDRRMPEFEAGLQPGDMAIITADHGCDPSWPGTEHTRENVPVLIFGPGVPTMDLGARETMADMGQTLATHLGVAALDSGTDCFADKDVADTVDAVNAVSRPHGDA